MPRPPLLQCDGLFGERHSDAKRTPDWVSAGHTPEGLGPLGWRAGHPGANEDLPTLPIAGLRTSLHFSLDKDLTASKVCHLCPFEWVPIDNPLFHFLSIQSRRSAIA